MTDNEWTIIEEVVGVFERAGDHKAVLTMAGFETDPITLAENLRDYCAATLRDPRTADAHDVRKVLCGISSGTLWPTDIGAPTHRHAACWFAWDKLTHRALHELLGQCPNTIDEED